MNEIDKLSKELYEKILEKWKQNTTRPLSYYVKRELKEFNEKVGPIIEGLIYAQLTSSLTKTIAPVILKELNLSSRLYKNSKTVQNSAMLAINEHIKRNETIELIRQSLYEGYNFKDKELLQVSQKPNKYYYGNKKILHIQKTLPKYLFGKVDEAKIAVMKMKSNSLKASYMQLLNSKNDKEFQKNLKIATYEKSRFYAERIAATEEHRAFSYSSANDILKDEELEFVRLELSGSHKVRDICDFYAELDVGYGAGVVKKENMLMLGLHPFCVCKYSKVYRKPKFKEIKNPEKTLINKVSEQQAVQMLGSKEKLRQFQNGKSAESIFNSVRPQYKIKKIATKFK